MGGCLPDTAEHNRQHGRHSAQLSLFAAMDILTISTCRDAEGAVIQGLTCPKKLRELTGSNQCTDAGDEGHPDGCQARPLLLNFYIADNMQPAWLSAMSDVVSVCCIKQHTVLVCCWRLQRAMTVTG